MMMARKVVNRRELREEAEAAERLGITKKAASPATKTAKTTKRKSRAKVTKEVRLKAFWGVFSQSLTPVAMFEYAQKGGPKEGRRVERVEEVAALHPDRQESDRGVSGCGSAGAIGRLA